MRPRPVRAHNDHEERGPDPWIDPARTGQGLDVLKRRLLRSLGIVPRHAAGEAAVFTERQERILARAASGVLPPEAARAELFREV